MILCPCGSQLEYENCCKPYHQGLHVPTAEALLRARFSAFNLQKFHFIVQTTHPDYKKTMNLDNITFNMQNVIWHQLHIMELNQEKLKNTQDVFDTIIFSAVYELNDNLHTLIEKSYFQKKNNTVYYCEDISHHLESYSRTQSKLGRNEPCSCGSGKKYKKCCFK